MPLYKHPYFWVQPPCCTDVNELRFCPALHVKSNRRGRNIKRQLEYGIKAVIKVMGDTQEGHKAYLGGEEKTWDPVLEEIIPGPELASRVIT